MVSFCRTCALYSRQSREQVRISPILRQNKIRTTLKKWCCPYLAQNQRINKGGRRSGFGDEMCVFWWGNAIKNDKKTAIKIFL